MENYIMLNGKKIPLTDEQVKLILADEPKKSPPEKSSFDRTENESYYCLYSDLETHDELDVGSSLDNIRYDTANYCTDENIMKQHALHMQLNNLLWRYSMTYGGDKIEFVCCDSDKYLIAYYPEEKSCDIGWSMGRGLGSVYFTDSKTARAAIEEIVKPFIEDHPEFDVTKM